MLDTKLRCTSWVNYEAKELAQIITKMSVRERDRVYREIQVLKVWSNGKFNEELCSRVERALGHGK